MDGLGFGIFGSAVSTGSTATADPDPPNVSQQKSDFTAEYVPPDVSEVALPLFQKQQKQTNVETLVPVVVSKVLSNISDPNQKLKIFSTPVFGLCVLGRVVNLEKLASVFRFDLDDSTGMIKVHLSNVSVELEEGDFVQVVGSLVLLSLDNFYIDSQHVANLGKFSKSVEDRVRFHNVLVAYAAYNLDVSEKLKLQNKHVGKSSTDLPGPDTSRNLDEVELGPEYAHVSHPLEVLVIKYLKASHDGISSKSSLVKSLSRLHPGTRRARAEHEIHAAIDSLVDQSEVVCAKDHICLVQVANG